MLEALRTNSALLKLDLYCQGLRLDVSCYVEEDGALRRHAGRWSAGALSRRPGPSPLVKLPGQLRGRPGGR
jgi:hypothetical protein